MKEIYIIRHAEKPGPVHEDRADDGVNLSQVGHTRAAALAYQGQRLFGQKVDAVYACAESKASIRPIETIGPYAKRNKQKLKTKIKDSDYKVLAKKLRSKKFDDKTVIICWHHGIYTRIAQGIQ